jgi:membrane protein DedA with SNARE-associated domain
MNLEQIIGNFSGASALWGPFGLLLACGLGLPVPEDIVLLAAGFLGAQNDIPFLRIVALMYMGILIGDCIVYSLGRFFGRRVLSSRIGRYLINQESLDRAEGAFTKYGRGVIFVGRFLPGLRAPIFFTAGLLRFEPLRFLFMDGLAALLSAPIFVWIGHWAAERYAEDLSQLQHTVGRTKLAILFLISLVAAALIFFWRKKNSKEKQVASARQE